MPVKKQGSLTVIYYFLYLGRFEVGVILPADQLELLYYILLGIQGSNWLHKGLKNVLNPCQLLNDTFVFFDLLKKKRKKASTATST